MAGALAIGLYHDAEPVPTGEPLVGQHRRDHVEAEVEPVSFLGIDVEAHIGATRHHGEGERALHQLVHHPLALHELVARMQCRKLDRNARVVAHRAGGGTGSEHRDGLGIGGAIALGVGLGARRLAQHVVGIGEAVALGLPRDAGRFLDVASEHELRAQDLHRLHHGGADHRLADALHEILDGAGNPCPALAQHRAGEGERQGGDIDQRRVGAVEMLGPARWRDLVFDQVVDGAVVGHPQQRLGEAHQRDALIGRQRIFGEEGFEHAARLRSAHLFHQLERPLPDGRAVGLAERRIGLEPRNGLSLVGKDGGPDAAAEFVEIAHLCPSA